MGCACTKLRKFETIRASFPTGKLDEPLLKNEEISLHPSEPPNTNLVRLDFREGKLNTHKEVTLLVLEYGYVPVIYSLPYEYRSYLDRFNNRALEFNIDIVDNIDKRVLYIFSENEQTFERYYGDSEEFKLARHFENGGEYNRNVKSFEIVDVELADYTIYLQ